LIAEFSAQHRFASQDSTAPVINYEKQVKATAKRDMEKSFVAKTAIKNKVDQLSGFNRWATLNEKIFSANTKEI